VVTLLYFAGLRETLGCSRENVALPVGESTVSMLIADLRNRDPKWSDAFGPDKRFRVAVNQHMADLSTPIKAGDEIAFFPPVTGG
jgi:molybdopterin synthase sulfur carrier subunit